MRKYVVTKINRNAVNGLIQKFIKSCEKKQHVYKFNQQIIFPYLTDEQVKNAKFYIPVRRTCKFNGVRLGDVVTLYGGNRIDVKGRYGTVRFIRIVPKNADIVARFLSTLAHPIPKIREEFLFDKVLISTNKKRYTSTVPVKESGIVNTEKLMQELKQLNSTVESENPSRDAFSPIKFTEVTKFTVSELYEFLNDLVKQGLILPTPVSRIGSAISTKTVANSCEAMYLDN